MAYSDQEIIDYARKLDAAGSPADEIDAFVADAKRQQAASTTNASSPAASGSPGIAAQLRAAGPGTNDQDQLGQAVDKRPIDPRVAGKGFDFGMEVLAPTIAAPGGPLVAGPVGAIGEAIVQLRRKMAGEQANFKAGEVAKQAVLNAIPLSRAAGPVRAAVSNAARVGAAGLAGEELRSLIDEGKPANAQDAVMSAALPAGGAIAGAAAGGLAGLVVNNRVMQALGNATRTKAAEAARDAGYIIPESGSYVDRMLQGVAGKDAVRQGASLKNAANADRLARAANGLTPNEELTSEAMQQLRRDAYNTGYAPVAAAGTVKTDAQYGNDLDAILANTKGAARSFPAAVSDEIATAVEPLRVAEFDAGDALKMSQILRNGATKAYSEGNNALGQAQRSASKAIEDQVERDLASRGQAGADMLKNFRDARQAMAVAHTTEDAIREGGGSIIPSKIGARMQNQQPLSGPLAEVGSMANNFPRYSQEASKIPQPGVSKVQAGLSLLAGGGAYGTTGNIPLSVAAAGAPYISDAARAVVLSKPYQSLMSKRTQVDPASVAVMTRLAQEIAARRRREHANDN